MAQLGLGDGERAAGGRAAIVLYGRAVGAVADPIECEANDAVLACPHLVPAEEAFHREICARV